MVFTVANEKGGSGKTTFALNLAGILSTEYPEILLIDSDPQQNSNDFASLREKRELQNIFTCIAKQGNDFITTINTMKNKFNHLVIDTQGSDSPTTRTAMGLADIIIVPVVPSILDFMALDSFLDTCNNCAAINQNQKTFIVMNRLSSNSFLASKTQEAIDFVKKQVEQLNNDRIQAMDTLLYERQTFRNSFLEGKLICELQNKDKASTEFYDFYNELKNKIF